VPALRAHRTTVGSGPVGRAVRVVVGVILILVGAVWFLQGIDVIKGSFMTGEAVWAVIGALCVVAGAVVLRAPRGTG
jgi:hypothetical protein